MENKKNKFRVLNKRNGVEIVKEMIIAKSFIDRMIGLMFLKEMEGFDSLLIEKCNSIHTFFMKFSLDVMFLDKEFKVVKIIKKISPWRVTLMYPRACKVLEMKDGTIEDSVSEGDILEVVCIN